MKQQLSGDQEQSASQVWNSAVYQYLKPGHGSCLEPGKSLPGREVKTTYCSAWLHRRCGTGRCRQSWRCGAPFGEQRWHWPCSLPLPEAKPRSINTLKKLGKMLCPCPANAEIGQTPGLTRTDSSCTWEHEHSRRDASLQKVQGAVKRI